MKITNSVPNLSELKSSRAQICNILGKGIHYRSTEKYKSKDSYNIENTNNKKIQKGVD